MDFTRLGADSAYTQQFAQQLLSNAAFRDAAIKANKAKEEQNKPSAAEETGANTPPASGLDNLLGLLSNAISQAANAVENPESAPGDDSVAQLLNHPFIKEALSALPLESALTLKVLMGQAPAQAAQQAVSLVNTLPADTVSKVSVALGGLSAENLEKGVNFFQSLFGVTRNDRAFTQGNNQDYYLNNDNSRIISGAELNQFLRTAYYVQASGNDIGKFLDQATDVINRGDYDDIDRFLSGADMVMYKKEDLSKYLDFSKKMLDDSHHDFESNIFQMYMTMSYGGSMQNYIDIAENLATSGAEGRNNLVDLTRIVVDFRQAGGYVPAMYQMLADEANEGGDVRALMNDYMALQGLEDTSPDFSRFARIERIDGDPMTIKQGESAALFAQAISTRDGLLPESVIYWSSLEAGALGHGSSYLDLSTLPPGTYTVAAKIGGYGLGTDTAFKTVIVEPGDGTTETTQPTLPVAAKPELVLPESGKVRILLQNGSAGLRSDLYVQKNGGDPRLVAQNAQKGGNVVLEEDYQAGDKLDFFIRTYKNGTSYDHGTNTEGYGDKNYFSMTQNSANSWSIGFEDLSGEEADWDYNDVQVYIELIQPASTGGGSETGETGATATIVGGTSQPVSPPPVTPYSAQETASITRTAIQSLGTGATASDVAQALNSRYYASVDAQISNNQDYTKLIEDARSNSGQLKTVLQQILKELTGEVPAATSAAATNLSNANSGSGSGQYVYNPYA